MENWYAMKTMSEKEEEAIYLSGEARDSSKLLSCNLHRKGAGPLSMSSLPFSTLNRHTLTVYYTSKLHGLATFFL